MERHPSQPIRKWAIFRKQWLIILLALGWSHKDQEIFTVDELIDKFSFDNVGKAAGVFNPEKLLWVNTTHLKEKTGEELAALIIPFFELMGYKIEADKKLSKMAVTLKERVKTLKEMAEQAEFYIKEDVDYDEKAANKFLTEDNVDLFKALISSLDDTEPFTQERIHKVFEELMTKMALKLGKMAQPVRVAITGGTVSPGIFETLEAMGKEKLFQDFKKLLRLLRQP